MKKPELSPFLIIISIVTIGLGSVPPVFADEGHVGDIQYSILFESQFQQLHGKEWELLKGQEVPWDSELRSFWTDSHLPDGRGVFLRSANHGRPRTEGNPEGTLPMGRYQTDVMVSHRHTVGPTRGGSTFISRGKGDCELQHGIHTGGCFHDNGAAGITRDTLHMSHEGGSETRPRNITVNVFVKIKESPKEAPELVAKAEWSPEQITELLNKPEFKNALADALQNFRKK